MEIIQTKLAVGAIKPFKIIHITDTHLTYADMRDGERKVILGKDRKKYFPGVEETLDFACKMAKKENLPVIHTGDLIDFVSTANLDEVKRINKEIDLFFAAGNHEFSLYVGEAKEDANYRNQSLKTVQNAFKNDIRMSSRIINGVNFIALDNGYYLFEEEQLDFLKKEVEKNYPIILLLHNPIYEDKLYKLQMSTEACAYLVDVPEELMQSYPLDRLMQQKSDEITHKMAEYIKSEKLIKAIITGHIHKNYEGIVNERIPQIATSCTDIRLIEIY